MEFKIVLMVQMKRMLVPRTYAPVLDVNTLAKVHLKEEPVFVQLA